MSDRRLDSAVKAIIGEVTALMPAPPNIRQLLAAARASSEASHVERVDPSLDEGSPPRLSPEVKALLALSSQPLTLVELKRKTRITPGTLSRCLGYMLDSNQISLQSGPDGRKFYITEKGRQALVDEAHKAELILRDLARLFDEGDGGTRPAHL